MSDHDIALVIFKVLGLCLWITVLIWVGVGVRRYVDWDIHRPPDDG